MDRLRNSKTIFLTVEGVGDRAIEYGGGSTVSEIALAVSAGPPSALQTVQVARTASVLPPALLIDAANLRFGDSIRVITLNPDIEVDESLVASCSATIDILSGPVAGTSYLLQPGTSKLGRVSTNDVTIVDPSISREHATVTVTNASIMIEDNGSTNGVTVGGGLVRSPTFIRSGERIKLGQSEAVVTHNIVPVRTPDLSYLAIPSPNVARYQGREVSLPSPPLMSDGNTRRSGRLSLGRNPQKQEVELFHMMLATLTSQLEQEQQIELAVRLVESPSFSEVVQSVVGRTSLWAKRAADPAGIEARVGIGNAPSRNRFDSVAGGPQELRAKLAATVDRFSAVPGAPVTVDFRELGTVGIQGPIDQARGLAYSLVGQLCATFGPDQLGVAFRPGDLAHSWDWLKWLPHIDFVGSAAGVADNNFVGWVSALFDEDKPANSVLTSRPAAILIILDDDRPLPLAVLSRLILDGPALGIHALLISSESRGFDAELGASVRVLDGIASVHRPNAEPIAGVAVETCDRTQAEGLARLLTPIGYRPEQSEEEAEITDAVSEQDKQPVTVTRFELGGAHPGILASMKRRPIPPPGRTEQPAPVTDALAAETRQLPDSAGRADPSQTPIISGPPAAPLAERPREQVPVLQPLPEELAAAVSAVSEDDAVESNGTGEAAQTQADGDAAAMPPPPRAEDAVGGVGMGDDAEAAPTDGPETPATPADAPPVANPAATAAPNTDASESAPANPASTSGPDSASPASPGPAAPGASPDAAAVSSAPPDSASAADAVDGAGSAPAEAAPPSERPLNLSSLPHPKDDSRLVLGTVHVDGAPGPAVFALNLPRDRSLGLTGGSGTGKTTALQSVATAAGMLQVPPALIPMVYFLDVHGDLEGIGTLPHVSGAARTDIVGFRSVISTLEEIVETRLQDFEAAEADSLADYRVNRPEETIGRIIVLVDDVVAVAEMLDSLHPGRWWDLAGKIIEHGGRIGVHLVFSAGRRADIDQELVPQIGRWLNLGTAASDGTPGQPGQAVVGKGRVRFAIADGAATNEDLATRKAG